MTQRNMASEIYDVLHAHRIYSPYGPLCMCGWSPEFWAHDEPIEREEHARHLSDMLVTYFRELFQRDPKDVPPDKWECARCGKGFTGGPLHYCTDGNVQEATPVLDARPR